MRRFEITASVHGRVSPLECTSKGEEAKRRGVGRRFTFRYTALAESKAKKQFQIELVPLNDEGRRRHLRVPSLVQVVPEESEFLDRAKIALYQRQFARAIQLASTSLELQPEHTAPALTLRARLLLLQGKLQLAGRDYEQLLELQKQKAKRGQGEAKDLKQMRKRVRKWMFGLKKLVSSAYAVCGSVFLC